MSSNVWTVPAMVARVVDGDTLILICDLGWNISYKARCRLIGCNAPELSTEEGQAARAWVIEQLRILGAAADGTGIEVMFISHQLDKYGRPLGQVLITSAQGGRFDLGAALISSGHAVPM